VDVSGILPPSIANDNIGSVVYAITVAGYAELRNIKTLLTLQERTVLTLVDGICPVAQYAPFLSEFAPVDKKMLKLEALGMLRRVGSVAKEAVDRFDTQVKSGEQISTWQAISSKDEASGFVPLSDPMM
jgi:hypothetical protein